MENMLSIVLTFTAPSRLQKRLRWYPHQPQDFIFTIFFEASDKPSADTPQLGFRELNGRKSC